MSSQDKEAVILEKFKTLLENKGYNKSDIQLDYSINILKTRRIILPGVVFENGKAKIILAIDLENEYSHESLLYTGMMGCLLLGADYIILVKGKSVFRLYLHEKENSYQSLFILKDIQPAGTNREGKAGLEKFDVNTWIEKDLIETGEEVAYYEFETKSGEKIQKVDKYPKKLVARLTIPNHNFLVNESYTTGLCMNDLLNLSVEEKRKKSNSSGDNQNNI